VWSLVSSRSRREVADANGSLYGAWSHHAAGVKMLMLLALCGAWSHHAAGVKLLMLMALCGAPSRSRREDADANGSVWSLVSSRSRREDADATGSLCGAWSHHAAGVKMLHQFLVQSVGG